MKTATNKTALVKTIVGIIDNIESGILNLGPAIMGFWASVTDDYSANAARKVGAELSAELVKLKHSNFTGSNGLLNLIAQAMEQRGFERAETQAFLNGMAVVSTASVSVVCTAVYGKSERAGSGGRKVARLSPIDRVLADIEKLDKISKPDAAKIAKAIQAKLS